MFLVPITLESVWNGRDMPLPAGRGQEQSSPYFLSSSWVVEQYTTIGEHILSVYR